MAGQRCGVVMRGGDAGKDTLTSCPIRATLGRIVYLLKVPEFFCTTNES